MARDSPARTRKVTWARMVSGPSGLATVFETSIASRTMESCMGAASDAAMVPGDVVDRAGRGTGRRAGDLGLRRQHQRRLRAGACRAGLGGIAADEAQAAKVTDTRSSMPASAAKPPRAASRACRGRWRCTGPGSSSSSSAETMGCARCVAQRRANLTRMIDLARGAGAARPAARHAHAAELWSRLHRAVSRQLQGRRARGEDSRRALPARQPRVDPNLMQADGVHPNERGQPRLLDNTWPSLQPLLRK